jgi:hypothetical protein
MTDADRPDPVPSVRRRVLDALPDIVASAGTGVIDWAVTGTPSAGALAPAMGLAAQLGADARSSRHQRGARALEAAADRIGGLDRLADAATADDARLELTARVIEAAMRTVHGQKIQALGRVLANGLNGHATVDESLILIAALDVIEAPHIHILMALREKADEHGPDVPPRDRVELLTLTKQQIIELLPGHEAVLGALTQVLEGYNLIDSVSGGMTYGHWGGSDRWAISPFGRSLLIQLEQG